MHQYCHNVVMHPNITDLQMKIKVGTPLFGIFTIVSGILKGLFERLLFMGELLILHMQNGFFIILPHITLKLDKNLLK